MLSALRFRALGFVGTVTGEIAVIDLNDGELLTNNYLKFEQIDDLVWTGDRLYALTKTSLSVYRLEGATLSLLGEFTGLQPYRAVVQSVKQFRFAVGGGIAYVPYINGTEAGFQTINVLDPSSMVELCVYVSPALAWKQITPMVQGGTGSCWSKCRLPATRSCLAFQHWRSLQFECRISHEYPTPSAAYAQTIYNGLGYIADGDAGLHVLNYLSPDFGGMAPTISLSSNAMNGAIEEGQILRLFANVSDDVQVRNVEFYIDGRLVGTDGNFPFEFATATSLLAGA